MNYGDTANRDVEFFAVKGHKNAGAGEVSAGTVLIIICDGQSSMSRMNYVNVSIRHEMN